MQTPLLLLEKCQSLRLPCGEAEEEEEEEGRKEETGNFVCLFDARRGKKWDKEEDESFPLFDESLYAYCFGK